MVTIAFYKGNRIWDRVIRYLLNSKYSHVELVMDRYSYSSSWLDGGVRRKNINFKPENWDFIQIDINENKVFEFFLQTRKCKYDLLSALLNNIGFRFDFKRDKYFCTEWVAAALNHGGFYINKNVTMNTFWEILND